MRIAVWHNLPSGGGKRALYDQVRGLIAQGHSVEAWCPPTAERNYLPLSGLIPEHVVALDTPRPPRLGRLGSIADISARLRAMDHHTRACAEQIQAGGFDLLFAHPCRLFRTVPIARYVSVATVLYLQEPNRWLYEAMPTPRWMALPPLRAHGRLNYRNYRRFVFDLIETQALRVQMREEVANAKAYGRVLVNSLYSRESLLRAYGVESTVCYLGIDTDLFVDRDGPRDRTVVGVGAIIPEKNVHLVIESLGRMSTPPRLVWIGNHAYAEYAQSLQALAARLGVGFEIRVDVSDSELVGILNRARLMVYAPRLEPFGYAPLEANACGLPVVAVAEGGVRETVLDGVNGLVVENDPRQIGDAVRKLCEDDVLRRRLASRGKELVKERWSLLAARDRLEARLLAVVGANASGLDAARLEEHTLERRN